jgi:hypothetical protein
MRHTYHFSNAHFSVALQPRLNYHRDVLGQPNTSPTGVPSNLSTQLRSGVVVGSSPVVIERRRPRHSSLRHDHRERRAGSAVERQRNPEPADCGG